MADRDSALILGSFQDGSFIVEQALQFAFRLLNLRFQHLDMGHRFGYLPSNVLQFFVNRGYRCLDDRLFFVGRRSVRLEQSF